jgi:hypothetical protein
VGRQPLIGRRLAIILATAPERGDFERVERLARAARARGVEVGIFLMDAAVVWGSHERTSALVHEDGCDVLLCGTNAGKLGVGAGGGVVEGSQDDHAALVHRADRVVAFT